jgi:hypothetical protein
VLGWRLGVQLPLTSGNVPSCQNKVKETFKKYLTFFADRQRMHQQIHRSTIAFAAKANVAAALFLDHAISSITRTGATPSHAPGASSPTVMTMLS